ncbi:hypothetical protein WR25_26303 [Diploscapter pachys]|uniref:Transthyretin/hydroxyisourate hydrolase domain-containing protein n=1 Tax=Diploscapter pachys TaxID=2018661 RepID=A0A2A2JQG2_9BILA|nr:hypothetical protein WR25_26303 [Diploscapter pachys]
MHVVGKLKCPESSHFEKAVKIELLDEDSLPLEVNDMMGRTWSTENGSFVISGCGSDAGPLNTPDPFLKIYHVCPKGKSPLEVNLVPLFLPNIVNIGTIYLDQT